MADMYIDYPCRVKESANVRFDAINLNVHPTATSVSRRNYSSLGGVYTCDPAYS